MQRFVRIAALAAVITAVCAGGASAATRTLYAGVPFPNPVFTGKHAFADVNAFSLPSLTVHVGDKVRWIFKGFHTVTFRPQGSADIPLVETDPAGTKIAGFNDAAGSPFWFNGQIQTILTPAGAFPAGNNVYDGSQLVGSGLPPQGNTPPPPFTVQFTRAGTFSYECVVHPGMDAKIKVVPASKPIPSAGKVLAQERLLEAVNVLKTLQLERSARTATATKTVTGGHDRGQIALYAFFPQTLHVKVGTTVNFKVTSPSEIHTFSFGPQSYLTTLANGFVVPQPQPAGPPKLEFNPQIQYPSDVPSLTHSGTNHGNGFLNTGILPNPSTGTTSQVTFTKAGTYQFICLIHPFMHGTVIVK